MSRHYSLRGNRLRHSYVIREFRLEVESLNACEMFGFAGGVSQMIVRDDGKRIIKRISDMSFVR